MEQSASPTTRLFNTLTVTMLAILLGLVCVRLKLVVPVEGDIKGMGFYVGSIAFPLLIFNTIATARLGSIHFSVIAACSLAKICVMVLTWLLAFLAYRARRSIGQRILTASVFAFFAVASNDFAIGFPVIDALYGDVYGMDVYIAGNAVVGSFVFVPLTMIAFAIGGALKGGDGDERPSNMMILKAILRDLFMNPVIIMTCAGLLFKVLLGHLLNEEKGKLKLPQPFSDMVELFTGPFAMLALFLTGTSLNSAQLSAWPCGLVLMKVVVCAYLSFAFGTIFLGSHDAGPEKILGDFTFFYGAIPTSSAPIVFASRFDPEAAELMATAVLFGLILAGPIMFVTAYSLNEAGDGDVASSMQVLDDVQASADVVSIFAGVLFMSLTAALRRRWNYHCPAKQLLAWYSAVLLAYNITSLASNPLVSDYVCDSYNKYNLRAPVIILFGWLQHICSLIKLVLMYMLVFAPKESSDKPLMAVGVVAVCAAVAALPAFFFTPNTMNEICMHKAVREVPLTMNVVWSYARLTAALILAAFGICRARRKHKALEMESHASDTEASEASISEVDEPEKETESSWRTWQSCVPKGIIMAITVLSIVKDLIQVVNAAEVHFSSASNKGSFAAMLLLESVLDHAQQCWLVAALFFDQSFAALLTKMLPAACPCIFRRRPSKQATRASTVWSLVTQPDPFDLSPASGPESLDE